MQNRYVGDIGDYVKLAILRALSPGYRLGVAWWLFPDEDYNKDRGHIGYLNRPEVWWHFDPPLFDALDEIVSTGQRDVRALERANVLPGAIFTGDLIPVDGPIARREKARLEWFKNVQHVLEESDLVFVDPDFGLESGGYKHGWSKSGKSILLTELRQLARPGRCLIVYHHHTPRKGGHLSEVEHWTDRLRRCGFRTVDALRARPVSPHVFFLLEAPADIRQRAEQIAAEWKGLITWRPDQRITDGRQWNTSSEHPPTLPPSDVPPKRLTPIAAALPKKSGRARGGSTTQVAYVNRNDQEVVRPTGRPGTDHGQYIYVLRCRTCGHEYGANGSNIFQSRCPTHDHGAPGLTF